MITIIFGRVSLSHSFNFWVEAYIHPIRKIIDTTRRKKVFLFSTSIYSTSYKYLYYNYFIHIDPILQKRFNLLISLIESSSNHVIYCSKNLLFSHHIHMIDKKEIYTLINYKFFNLAL